MLQMTEWDREWQMLTSDVSKRYVLARLCDSDKTGMFPYQGSTVTRDMRPDA